jgi:hypothetical protein
MLHNPIRTTAVAIGAAALMTVAAAASSSADGVGVPGGGRPVLEPITFMDFVLPATPDDLGVCPFPVRVADEYSNQKVRRYEDGSTKGTGQLLTRLTNLTEPSKTILVNISGPGRTYTDAAGVFHFILKGASLTWVTRGKDTTGTVPIGLYLRHGSVDYDGDFNLLSYTGTAENLCEALS